MTKWKQPANPRTAVQMMAVDLEGNLLVMHRSKNVRSAANCWSFPSGLHDIGETQEATAVRELEEEYGLTGALSAKQLLTYENIAGDLNAEEQYHWVISLYVVVFPTVTVAQNKEPEKHDEMKFVHYSEIGFGKFFEAHQFHPSFHKAVFTVRSNLAQGISRCILAHTQRG